jgi:hypothetical protein
MPLIQIESPDAAPEMAPRRSELDVPVLALVARHLEVDALAAAGVTPVQMTTAARVDAARNESERNRR